MTSGSDLVSSVLDLVSSVLDLVSSAFDLASSVLDLVSSVLLSSGPLDAVEVSSVGEKFTNFEAFPRENSTLLGSDEFCSMKG
jgi:hypothetical protein